MLFTQLKFIIMEIPIFAVIANWKHNKAKRIIDKLKSDGWNLTNKNQGLFTTTYSFTKII